MSNALFCTDRFHYPYYSLLLVLRTFAEDTDFLSFPKPVLILFPTEENLGFSVGFSLVGTPACFFAGPTPWCRRLMVDLKDIYKICRKDNGFMFT